MNNPTRRQKHMSLSAQTHRIRARVAAWSKQGRKHWDIYRYLTEPYLLCDAVRLVVANGGAAGIDGQTVKDIKGREWELAVSLSQQLAQGSYQSAAVRRVYIPKGNGEDRPLGIPNLCDRVVQRAMCLLLEMIYEQKFHEFSYGFRPRRKATDCVAELAKAVNNHRYVLEADIEKFFDRMSHNKLLKLINKEIVDPRLVGLIAQILKAGVQQVGKPWEPSLQGTPQGGPLSPMLANIYLHYLLDEKFVEVYGNSPRVKMFRYADDFVIAASNSADIQTAHRLLGTWMLEAGLTLKHEKTREVNMTHYARSYESKFDFLGYKLHLRCYPDNHKRFWIARQPSEKARGSLRRALKERLQAHLHPQVIKAQILATWRGWCEYFRYGNSNQVFYRELNTVRRAVWRYLRRKFRRSGKLVKWSRLKELHTEITADIRPPRCINSTGEKRQTAFEFGRA